MPVQGFINDFWGDVLSILSVVGFVLTALGVWLAYVQIRRTATAAQAATEAAIATYNESRDQYKRYVIAQADRLLAACHAHVKGKLWLLAVIRIGDLTDLLLQLTDDDLRWGEFSSRLEEVEQQFDRIQQNRIKYSDRLSIQWETLYREIRQIIRRKSQPFEFHSRETHEQERPVSDTTQETL